MDGTRDLHDHDLEAALDVALAQSQPAAAFRSSYEQGLREGFENGRDVCADKLDLFIAEHVGGFVARDFAAGLREIAAEMRREVPP